MLQKAIFSFACSWLATVCLCSAGLKVAESETDENRSPASQPIRAGSAKTRTSEQRAKDSAALAQAAAGCAIRLESGQNAELRREAIYRWSNPIAATIEREVRDAGVFVWTLNDRPVVIGSVVWYTQLGMYHEFQSLAVEPLTAEREGKKIWEPAQAGVEFKPLADTAPPAAIDARRLIQMKSIAERFRAEVIKGPPSFPAGSVWQLRLLPKPLLRYGNSSSPTRDGAIFAFCQDADPDVFLMLEARAAGDELAWHFAMGPLTSRETKAWYGDQLIWSKPLIQPPSDSKRPYFVAGPFPVP